MPPMGLQVSSAKLQCRSPNVMQQLRKDHAEQRAKEAAEKLLRSKEQKERLEQIKRAVVDSVVESGDSEEFGNAVATLVEKRGSLLQVLDDVGSVDGTRLHVFKEDVIHQWFDKKLRMIFPSWPLTELQKAAVIQRIKQNCSISELSKVVTNLESRSVWQDALAYVLKSSEHFTCPICMDPLIELSPSGTPCTYKMWSAQLRKNEHWSSQPCGHACCRECMKTWVETGINDQKQQIRCPAPACSYCLFDHDVQALVSPVTFERYQERKNADYLTHLKKALKADVRLNTWLKNNARPCPDCHVIVSRYEGCDSMQCVCGAHFCYACGFKNCKCGKKRRDIWKPKAST